MRLISMCHTSNASLSLRSKPGGTRRDLMSLFISGKEKLSREILSIPASLISQPLSRSSLAISSYVYFLYSFSSPSTVESAAVNQPQWLFTVLSFLLTFPSSSAFSISPSSSSYSHHLRPARDDFCNQTLARAIPPSSLPPPPPSFEIGLKKARLCPARHQRTSGAEREKEKRFLTSYFNDQGVETVLGKVNKYVKSWGKEEEEKWKGGLHPFL